MVKKGTWWVTSKSDPRWYCEGECDVGGFEMPEDCKAAIARKTQELGEPPEDLTWHYMKD